ncbi:MFS transporter, partial [Rhizobium johnstonii]|uniref:MFS transporter n=1 Tax=Rhizobium johnstonii TaxID=3019933 RepID=UPI003F955789
AHVTAALGLPLGGVLVGIWDWRAVFAINIPLGLIGIVMTLIWIPRDEPRVRSERHGRGLLSALDPAGLTLFAVTITSVIFFLQSIPN